MSFGDDTLEILTAFRSFDTIEVPAAKVFKIYLAGPMTGLPNFNFPAFDYAAKKLREQGFVVFSPAERDREVYGDVIEDNKTGDIVEAVAKAKFNAAETMEADTCWICRHATAIALLPGWEKSRGVGVELALARYLGLTVIELGSEYTKNG